MRSLRVFLVGTGTSALVLYTFAAALGLAVAAAGGTLRAALGPLVLLEVERSDGVAATTFGFGLAVAALVGGTVNLFAAALLDRRR